MNYFYFINLSLLACLAACGFISSKLREGRCLSFAYAVGLVTPPAQMSVQILSTLFLMAPVTMRSS